MHTVIAALTTNNIITATGMNGIGAINAGVIIRCAAPDGIASCTSGDGIIAETAVYYIITFTGINAVITGATIHYIIAFTGINGICCTL